MIIYLVMRNSDMTEGRGPMTIDSVWLNKKKAETYMDKQDGVMGRKIKWSISDCGDWKIKTLETMD